MKYKSVILLTVVIFKFNSTAKLPDDVIQNYMASPSLYYTNFDQEEKSISIKEGLYKILNSAHVYKENNEDEIADNCLTDNCYKHQSLGYREARKILFGQIELQESYGSSFIVDYYCHTTFKNHQVIDGHEIILGVDLIPTSRVINTEHTWPKSKFPVKEEENPELYEYMLTDLHHLIPTDSIVNRDRHNYPFGEVTDSSKDLKCAGPKLGTNIDIQNQIFFGPPNDVKGDIARGLMYFSVKYNTPIDPIQENFLRKWDMEDPISQKEIRRNNIIHQNQGVRNPFIDFENLASKISDF